MSSDNENVPLVAKIVNIQTQSIRRWMLLPVTVLYILSIAIMMYILPEYIHERLDQEYTENHNASAGLDYTIESCSENVTDISSPEYQRYKFVQKETAYWQNYFHLASNIPGVIANVIWASYSDIIGRRRLLIVFTFACFVRLTLFTAIVYCKVNIAYIIFGEIINGLAGSYGTFLSVIYASIADITSKGRSRTVAITVMEILLGIPFTLAIVCGGYFVEYYGFFYPSLAALCSSFVALCISLFLVPETLQELKKGGYQEFVSSISTALKLYFKPESRRLHMQYILLALGFIFFTMQAHSRGPIEILYQLGKPFCWSYTKIGWFGAVMTGALTVGGVVGVVGLKKVLADDSLALLSAALTVVSYIVEAMAKTAAVVYTVPVLASFSVLPLPLIRSMMSHLTPMEKQGALFATLGSLDTLCTLIGSLTGNWVYSATLGGLVFLYLGVMNAISCVMIGSFMYVSRRHNGKDKAQQNTSSAVATLRQTQIAATVKISEKKEESKT